ncbi:MAG: RNA polymerase sigma factor [Dehalococcoidia bacterium]
MAAYRPIDEAGLARLDDPGLIDQAVAARAAGDEAQAELALKIFAFGLEGPLLAFVRNRMGSHGDAVVEEITGRALEDAIRSITKLRGSTAEEGRAFVFKIARLRIADFLRKGRLRTDSIDDEESGGSADRHAGMAVEDIADAIDTNLVYEQALGDLRPDHREAVELFLISGYSARETAEKVGSRFDGSGNDSMSEQNVNQIVSRFRKDLRTRLGQEGKG